MVIQKRERMTSSPVRLPVNIRDKAKAFAKENGVTESEVYRSIISAFFLDQLATKGSQKIEREGI